MEKGQKDEQKFGMAYEGGRTLKAEKEEAWGNMAVAHKTKERMAWKQLFITLFHTTTAEWHCHRTADAGRDLCRVPSESPLLREEVATGSREDCVSA